MAKIKESETEAEITARLKNHKYTREECKRILLCTEFYLMQVLECIENENCLEEQLLLELTKMDEREVFQWFLENNVAERIQDSQIIKNFQESCEILGYTGRDESFQIGKTIKKELSNYYKAKCRKSKILKKIRSVFHIFT